MDRRPLIRRLIPEQIPWFGVRLYDRIAAEAVPGYYREVAGEIAAFLDRGRVLDVGSGPGYLLLVMARLAPELRLVGIDRARGMVRLARRRAREADLADRVRFQPGDGNRLPFPDGSFDMVVSTGAFHAWRDPVRVLDECCRVLRPGGEAWVYDPAQLDTPAGRRIMESLRGLDRLVGRWASWAHRMNKDKSEAEIRAIMARSRFGGGELEERLGRRLRMARPRHD